MFFQKFEYPTIECKFSKDKSGRERVRLVDTFPEQSFNVNPDTGWPSSDISLFERAQTEAEKSVVLSRLQEIRADGGFPADMSLRDQLLSIKPRLIQSLSELQAYEEAMASYIIQQNKDLLDGKDDVDKKDDDKDVLQPVDGASASVSE